MKMFWFSPLGGGLQTSPVQWRNAPACSVKIADKFKTASNEVDNAHNVIMMWKHFGTDERLAKVIVSLFTLCPDARVNRP